MTASHPLRRWKANFSIIKLQLATIPLDLHHLHDLRFLFWPRLVAAICCSQCLDPDLRIHDFLASIHAHNRQSTCYTVFSSRPNSVITLFSRTLPNSNPNTTHYIFDLISANNSFSLSISVFCCGHPIDNPSSVFGLGI